MLAVLANDEAHWEVFFSFSMFDLEPSLLTVGPPQNTTQIQETDVQTLYAKSRVLNTFKDSKFHSLSGQPVPGFHHIRVLSCMQLQFLR